MGIEEYCTCGENRHRCIDCAEDMIEQLRKELEQLRKALHDATGCNWEMLNAVTEERNALRNELAQARKDARAMYFYIYRNAPVPNGQFSGPAIRQIDEWRDRYGD